MTPLALWTCLLPLAAAAEKTPSDGQGSPLTSLLFPLGAMVLIFYFLLIRPQSKRQRERADMLGQLKKGDKILTAGGIVGVVTLVREHEVVLKADDNCKLTLGKSYVLRILQSEESEAKDEKKDEKK